MKTFTQLFALTKRILKQNLTNTDTLITVFGTPIFMLLFFVYVFGGSISLNGTQTNTSDYLNYALPGFMLITMTMGSAYTSLRINMDKTSGFLDRLHTLPIKRWIVLGSHIVASVVFMLLSELTTFVIGLIMGFRPELSIGSFFLFLLLSVLFAFAMTMISIPFSISAKSWESAGSFSYLLIMLLFVSSAFVPTDGMAKPIEIFADHQPMTPIVEAARALLMDIGVNNGNLLQAFGWLMALVVIFAILSYRKYQKVF
ncbi:ABC transporter permease [Enterococcus dongliensis]|uniref:Transport permease protein n=1 Tax=Enterococcus dongliensis TaxID=2559925 RepID=A0AAP5KN99_9ENTE|nr:ABC transporter permease [Enterococcus dongliensis]MDT2595510.1 ABC transporter permease [Enterococcus dongliensis]MDT2603274.1 ABC transporter permease [Enterococcus dongliensis]MDT2633637.1 ABC transporter permease [Enterococcus dongliensis]MDT2635989.1 ABC transporter permease [Enterococcus dongliensis]MDT2639737.1 ABC transporter permease [Enterococcus dongliensis]